MTRDGDGMAATSGEGGTVRVLRHVLPARSLGLPRPSHLWDAIVADDGRTRVFFGGCAPPDFTPDGAPGCLRPDELRAIGPGTMLVCRAAGDLRIALACGNAVTVRAEPDATALMAGRNATLGFRIDETPAQVAEAVAWHARAHGLTGAVIVNRVPGEGFAEGLREALAALPAALPHDVTVIVADLPLPAGRPSEGPANHPLLAPDAPGKDRMTPPAPDPWRAPLADEILLEVMKWRYLARARGVLALDVTDILPVRVGPSAFDRCAAAAGGVVLLVGQRTYPWRVRDGAEPMFGDHTCRPFDRRRGIARWGAAPGVVGLDGTWRPARVSHARPDPGQALGFLRAMAIRVPGRTTSELVPKTALIEDPALLALAIEGFGHRPVRAPRSALREDPGTDRTTIVTTMKNEGPFILEWLAYHRSIGVDDFLIYSNDCTDGTDALLDVLDARGIVQHRANPYRATGLPPQHAALQAAEDEPAMKRCGWGLCMDVDEFINVRVGDGTLAALRAAMAGRDANMIAMTWRLFGSADVHRYEDRFVLDQFARCAPELIRKPHHAWGFKTMFRNIDIYRKLGVHRPKGLRPALWDQVRWLNGSGEPMPAATIRNGWRSTLETYGYGWVQLNHYAVRSAESFLVKRDRGRVNHVDRDQGLNYWFRMNHNVGEDRSIQRMVPGAVAERDRLLADPAIRAAHADCVARHRARIAALRAQPEPAAFFADLTSARMERLCRMQPHFGAAVFAEGPAAVPDALLAADLVPGFQFGGRPVADDGA